MALKETKCKMLLNGKLSEVFRVNRGLRQGHPLPLILLNLILEKVIRNSGYYTNGTIYRHKNHVHLMKTPHNTYKCIQKDFKLKRKKNPKTEVAI